MALAVSPPPSARVVPSRVQAGIEKYMRSSPPLTIATGPHGRPVGPSCTVGADAVASNQTSLSAAGIDTHTRPPGPVATDVGLPPTPKRFSTAPAGVIWTTEPL